MTPDQIKLVQIGLESLGYKPGKIDGSWGPKTQAAYVQYRDSEKIVEREYHSVIASSFADPADIKAFRKCKAQGKSDQECFSKGDNGIGKWGDDTTKDIPMCALPPEYWKPLGNKARGAKVEVTYNDNTIICELRDTMPSLKNIKNGAGIDLNAAAVEALGLTPPIMVPVTWNWI